MRRLLPLSISIHLLVFGNLAANGQMVSREFHSGLSANNQTRFTESPVTGSADFELDLATLTLTWDVQFEGLISPPVAAGLHGPAQPGANGLSFIDLAPEGIASPLRGSAVVNEAQVQYLLAGWTYVNITTEKYPFGEARGQLDVGPKE